MYTEPMTTTQREITTRYLGRCDRCGLGVCVQGERARTVCPECDIPVATLPVQGRMVLEVNCDARCEYATGDQCECSCAGDNHGAGYGYTWEELPAKVQQRDRKRHAAIVGRREAKAAAEAARRESWLAENRNREVIDYLTANRAGDSFFASLSDQYTSKGALSVGQVSAVIRNIERDRVRAERVAQAAQLVAAGVNCPSGKVTITGTVVSTKVEDGYGGYGATYRMLVTTEQGWKVWGTAPRSVWPDGGLRDLKGKRVRFTATVHASNSDPLFGYYKRPTQAEVIG